MARVSTIGQRAMNVVLKKEPGVQAAVLDAALEIGAEAEVLLAAHRRTGNAKIEVEQGKVDSYVVLDDPAAMSIEFGHIVVNENGPTGEYVEGLHILYRASGLI